MEVSIDLEEGQEPPKVRWHERIRSRVKLSGKSILLGGLKMASVFAAGILMPSLLAAAAPLIADTLTRRIRDATNHRLDSKSIEKVLLDLSTKENLEVLTGESFDASLELGAFKGSESKYLKAVLKGNLKNAKQLMSDMASCPDPLTELKRLLHEEWGNRIASIISAIEANQSFLMIRMSSIGNTLERIDAEVGEIGEKIGEMNASLHGGQKRISSQVVELPSRVIEAIDTWARTPTTGGVVIDTVTRQLSEEEILAFEERVKLLSDSELVQLETEMFENSDYRKLELVERARVRINPRNAVAWGNLGLSLGAQRQFENAEKALQTSIEMDPNLAISLRNLAYTYSLQGRYEDACRAFEKAVEVNPRYFEVWDERGTTLRQLGNLYEAEESYRRALQINPLAAETWGNLGSLLAKTKRHKEAEEAYRKAISISPASFAAWINLGNLLAELKRNGEAVRAYKNALKWAPGDYHANLNLGILYTGLGTYELAEQCLHEALKSKGNQSYVRFALGNLYHNMGRIRDAEESYVKAIELNPRFLEAWHNLGNVHARISLSQTVRFTKTFAETVEKLKDPLKAREKALGLTEGTNKTG